MKSYTRSIFKDLSIKVNVDSEGFVQESFLIKDTKSYKKFKFEEFSFKVGKLSKATDFQKKVYKSLLKVKTGSVISYKELAKKSGSEKAARAVGTAMAKNPVVYFVPCHRVLKSCGSLGQFSGDGGVKTKQALLEFEKRS